jgi:hypothetical protein
MPDRSWRVLIASTGYGLETLRGVVQKHVADLGFEPLVYDSPGYPADPSVHSHIACVRAISQADIVIAFVDESLGGEFQLQEAPAEMQAALVEAGIFERPGITGHGVSITQVEVRVARFSNKPTLVFVPREVQANVQTLLELLKGGRLAVSAKPGVSESAEVLVSERKWDELNRNFVVPSGQINTFGQLCFIEELRKQKPNFVNYYDRRTPDDLCARLSSALSNVATVLLSRHDVSVTDRIEKARSPLSRLSLQDLYRNGMILAPPARALSGPGVASAVWEDLARSLRDRKSVLLIGDPGLGKTTASLFTFKEVSKQSSSSLDPSAPLFASWLEIDAVPDDAEHFVRRILGQADHKEPWPERLLLPELPYVFVLDGIDEAVDRVKASACVVRIGAEYPIFVSCRRGDYERSFRSIETCFNRIIELRPWGDAEISQYIAALEGSGFAKGAELIRRWRLLGAMPDIVSIPLWLSMIAFLGQDEYERSGTGSQTQPLDEYELLSRCSDAVAQRELTRANIQRDDLFRCWADIAWAIHTARRENLVLLEADLPRIVGHEVNSPPFLVLASLLNVSRNRVHGYFHEVFQEYWLASYLTQRMLSESSAEQLVRLLMYQRSVVTNKFLRMGLLKKDVGRIAAHLRDAFWSAHLASTRTVFVKNQLVYLLGRIDGGGASTRSFLHNIWRSAENPVIRHSAAFALTMVGEKDIEREFYQLLLTSSEDDAINRGYHMYYYNDIDIPEEDVPRRDDGSSVAPLTLRQLGRRLGRTAPRHLRLRRIELLTVRRFLETARQPPADAELRARVVDVLNSDAHEFGDEFAQGVKVEGRRVLELLAQQESVSDSA